MKSAGIEYDIQVSVSLTVCLSLCLSLSLSLFLSVYITIYVLLVQALNMVFHKICAVMETAQWSSHVDTAVTAVLIALADWNWFIEMY